MIELLKGSRITSSQSAAGTGPQGISKAVLTAVQELAARQALLDQALMPLAGDVIFEHIKATCLGVTRDASPPTSPPVSSERA